jgi:hypothetical protein
MGKIVSFLVKTIDKFSHILIFYHQIDPNCLLTVDLKNGATTLSFFTISVFMQFGFQENPSK